MDTRWMRVCWPGDKNHRSSKLETGRNVGNAPIKSVFPTWTQYTRAQLPLWKPKTPQHYFISQSTNTLCSNADGIGFRWDSLRCLQTLHSYRALQSSYMINALLCHAQPFCSGLNIWGSVSKTVSENVAQLFYWKSYGMSWYVVLHSARKGTDVSCLEIMTKIRHFQLFV